MEANQGLPRPAAPPHVGAYKGCEISGLAAQLHAQPLKVFILAGQSNMEGHAKIETFAYIAATLADLERLPANRR